MNRKRILIVDDDPVVLKALSMRLSGAGYDVLLADDGAAAVSAVRQNRPDLILLDISFPPDVFAGSVAWDGFLILEWLRRIDEAKNTPVIMISHTISAEIVEIAERARAAGAIEFFAKPVDTNRLIELVGRLLDPATVPEASGIT